MSPPKRPRAATAHPTQHAITFAPPTMRTPPSSNLLTRILTLPLRPFRRKRPKPPPKPLRPKSTSQEWGALIQEFESRARSAPPPPRRRGPVENPDQYEMLPYCETAFMVSLTTVMWWLGRMMRLDAFLLLLYPIPTIYIAARHGLLFAHYALASTLLLVFSLVGPLYCFIFFLNTGLLTLAYARALWHRWPWWVGLLAGGFAKSLGLWVQLSFMGKILEINAWEAVGIQVTASLTAVCTLLGKVGLVINPPGMRAVQIGIGVIVGLHSFYHVFFAQLCSTLILRRVAETEKLSRVPPDMPLVRRLLNRARRP